MHVFASGCERSLATIHATKAKGRRRAILSDGLQAPTTPTPNYQPTTLTTTNEGITHLRYGIIKLLVVTRNLVNDNKA
jgi:hypothetical protein